MARRHNAVLRGFMRLFQGVIMYMHCEKSRKVFGVADEYSLQELHLPLHVVILMHVFQHRLSLAGDEEHDLQRGKETEKKQTE